MGHSTLYTAGTSAQSPSGVPSFGRQILPGASAGYDEFAAALRHDLAPRTVLERVLVDRLTLAAWRLNLVSLVETDAASEGDDLPPLSGDTLRAERSLETALELLETARSAARTGWGHATQVPSTPVIQEHDDDLDDASFSNEWPVLPRDQDSGAGIEDDQDEDDEEAVPVRWQDRLVFDADVSDTSPVVKGTWVTVGHVVSLIVDGWTWTDVLRAHPELTEDDIRTCLAYTVEQDNAGEY